MNDPRIAIRRAERNIIDLLTSIEPGKERDDHVAEAIAELDAAKAQAPTPEDEAKAKLEQARIAEAARLETLAAQIEAQEQAAKLLPDDPTPDDLRAAAAKLRADRREERKT